MQGGGRKGGINDMARLTSAHLGCVARPNRNPGGCRRMRSYEAANITSPARSIEVDETEVNRG